MSGMRAWLLRALQRLSAATYALPSFVLSPGTTAPENEPETPVGFAP